MEWNCLLGRESGGRYVLKSVPILSEERGLIQSACVRAQVRERICAL